MHKLMFATYDLSLGGEGNIKAKHLNIQIYSGETVAVLGLMGSGKGAFTGYLCGEEKRMEGAAVCCEKCAKAEYLEKSIRRGIYISKSNGIFTMEPEFREEISIAEYLFIMQGRQPNMSFWNQKKEEEQTKAAMEQIGLRISPRQRLAALSKVEWRLLDLAKACVLGAHLVLMYEDFEDFSQADIVRLAEALEKMKNMGIAFLLDTNDLKCVEYLADRCILFKDGTIIKKIRQKGQITSDEIRAYLWDEKITIPDKKEAGGKRVYEWRDAPSGDGEERRLYFPKGNITNLVISDVKRKLQLLSDLTGAYPQKRGSWYLDGIELSCHRIVSVQDITGERELLYHLTVGENLLVPNMVKLRKKGVFVPEKLASALKHQWEERMGYSVPDEVNRLTLQERMRLILERWMIYHPDVLIMLEPFVHIDLECRQIILQYMREFAYRGTAVIVLSSNGRDYKEEWHGHPS